MTYDGDITPRTFEDNVPLTLSNTNKLTDSVRAHSRQFTADLLNQYSNQFQEFKDRQEEFMNQAREIMHKYPAADGSYRPYSSTHGRITEQDETSDLTSDPRKRPLTDNANLPTSKADSVPTSQPRNYRWNSQSNPYSPQSMSSQPAK